MCDVLQQTQGTGHALARLVHHDAQVPRVFLRDLVLGGQLEALRIHRAQRLVAQALGRALAGRRLAGADPARLSKRAALPGGAAGPCGGILLAEALGVGPAQPGTAERIFQDALCACLLSTPTTICLLLQRGDQRCERESCTLKGGTGRRMVT